MSIQYKHIKIINITVLFVTCSICLIMLEVFVRIFYPQTLAPLGNYDRVLGWRNVPSSSSIKIKRDYKVMVNINSKGLRASEYSYKKPYGTSRILVLGDSFTWGAGVEDNETFSNVLENMLGENVEIINAGVNGYGTDQEYLYLITEGYKYKPDIVLLAFCLNDIENNMLDFDRGGIIPKPRFVLDGDSLKLTNVPVPMIQKTQGIVSSFKSFLRSHFHLYVILRNIKNHLKYKYSSRFKDDPIRSKNTLTKLQNARRSLGFINEGEAIYFPFLKEWPKICMEGWNLTKKILAKAGAYCKNMGATFIVVLIPYNIENDELKWANSIKRYKLNPQEFDLSKPTKIFQNFGIENNIRIILLSDSFKKPRRERLYFEHDGHWNKHGHRLAAKEIHGSLIKNHLIEPETDH